MPRGLCLLNLEVLLGGDGGLGVRAQLPRLLNQNISDPLLVRRANLVFGRRLNAVRLGRLPPGLLC